MKVQMSFALFFTVFLSIQIESDGGGEGNSRKSRKHYGLSYHVNCRDYIKTFTCMSACKSIGFQIFRMDYKCKCSCHELKTTTILPFFKWRTNGTTQTWAKTQSALLYHVIGTRSPATYPDYTEENITDTTVNNNSSSKGNETQGNSTDGKSGDSVSSQKPGDGSDKPGESTAASQPSSDAPETSADPVAKK